MLSRILSVCLFLTVCSEVSALSCRWMDHRFKQFSENYLQLLQVMVNNTNTNSTDDAEVVEDAVAFPYDLYSQASKATAEVKLAFTVQVLEEIADLLEQDHSAASWDERNVEDFLNIVTQQADGLHSCIASHGLKKKNKKMHMYFKRLSRHVLEQNGHSAEAWELVRKEIQSHLMRADHLVSSLLATN